MPIPTAFEVRLAAYGITPDVLAARREVWAIVAPGFAAVVNDYLDASVKFAPAVADLTNRHRAEFFEVITGYTAKLFLAPMDEAWVADARARAKFEIDKGLDLRVRRWSRRIFCRAGLRRSGAITASPGPRRPLCATWPDGS
jgi:hypothetical protein